MFTMPTGPAVRANRRLAWSALPAAPVEDDRRPRSRLLAALRASVRDDSRTATEAAAGRPAYDC